MTLSADEVAVLGYSAAGWTRFEISESNQGKKTYGFGVYPLSDEESLYSQAHPEGKRVSKQKINAMEAQAKTGILEALNSLSLEAKQALINEFNLANGNIFTEKIQNSDDIDEYLNSKVGSDYFIEWLGKRIKQPKKNDEFNLAIEELEKNRPHIKVRIEEFSKKNYQTSQDTAWHSKRIIADILQENIRRYHAGIPLIPIKILLRSDFEQGFAPKVDDIQHKKDVYITPSEIRAIYKLMHEIPDEDIRKIMLETTSFHERTKDNKFVEVDPPWKDKSWENRARGQRGQALKPYSERSNEEIPKWIRGMMSLNKRYAAQKKAEELYSAPQVEHPEPVKKTVIYNKFNYEKDKNIIEPKAVEKPAELHAKIQKKRPIMPHIANTYKYKAYKQSEGRKHALEIDASKFTNIKAELKNLKGDFLKTKILEHFKKQIENSGSKQDLDELKEKILKSDEYKLLTTGQGVFTRLTGIKTSSEKVLISMFEEQEKNLPTNESSSPT